MFGLKPFSCGRALFSLFLAIVAPVAVYSQNSPGPLSGKRNADDGAALMRYRFRLQDNPHDKQAHDGIIELLRAKNAFRAELEEEGNWLKNNPDDEWRALESNIED